MNKLRADLIDIAFLLEPQVDELLTDYREQDTVRYEAEHTENDAFYDDVIITDVTKFESHYAYWKESVVRFHKLKQEDAITKFLARMNSDEFVNPRTRTIIFQDIKDEQMKLYNQRSDLLQQLAVVRPTLLNKTFVEDIRGKLEKFNEESEAIFDVLTKKLTDDMINTNEDIDIAEADLLDFLQKNDAELEEGETLESIMAEKAMPTTVRRKLESKTLNLNAIKYQEDTETKMGEICENVINFYQKFAKTLDDNKEKLKATETNFQLDLAKCADNWEETVDGQEEELNTCKLEMTHSIHHVQLNDKLKECFDILDKIQVSFRNLSAQTIEIV